MTPLLLISVLGLATFGGNRELRAFENSAAREISSKLQGENKKVAVRTELIGLLESARGEVRQVTIQAKDFATPGLPLFVEPERQGSGRIRNLKLELSNFSLNGLAVEYLEANIPSCRYDFGLALRKREIRLTESGVGTGYVRMKEKALETFILRKVREIKRVSVKIDRDVCWVEGYGEFLVATTDFTVIAKLEPTAGGSRLELTNAKIYFDWRRADPFSAKTLLDLLNPVVDFRTDLNLIDAVSVNRLKLRDGVLEAWGSTKIPTRPALTSLNVEASIGFGTSQ